MEFIVKFAQILFIGLLVLVLATATSSASVGVNFAGASNMVAADCAGMRHVSGDQKPSNQHLSGAAVHCCSIGHCWVAVQTEAPSMAVEMPRNRVADLTHQIAVVAASTRLEKPPQQL